MNERPTPETDAAVVASNGQWSFVLRDTCKRLERERDEAIAARKASAADWLGQIDQANARVSRALRQVALAERERDEAREALAEEMKFHHRTHSELVHTQCQMQDVIRERDEARELAEQWRQESNWAGNESTFRFPWE